MDLFSNSLGQLPLLRSGKSRCVNWENRNGEKGKGGMEASNLGPSRKGSPCIPLLAAGETKVLADIEDTAVIQHIWITVTDRTSDKNRFILRDLVLRMYWDGEETPFVESPLGDFFCCGFGASYSVNSLPVSVNPIRGFNCYFPMPFRKGAKITIENQCDEDIYNFFYQIDYVATDELPENIGYFHAQWRRQRCTEIGKDYVILDGVTGKGQYIGTYMALTALERSWYGEGEIKFYIDGDEKYPTICGTGTEDYFGGAWAFAVPTKEGVMETPYSTPFLGFPYYSNHPAFRDNPAHDEGQLPQRSFYRWHIMDPILFEEDLRVTIQQIGVRPDGLFEREDDVATVAYWYQSEPHQPFGKLMDRMKRWPR